MNNSHPKISIIFPSYNGENVIFKNLKSIEKLENLNEIELVIIDNNSIDSTKEIIKSFKNININLIEADDNLGFAKACNIGAIKAKGEFIFITNQDVAFPTDFFKILLNIYERKKKNQELIISPALVFPGNYINYFGAKIHFLGFSYTPDMYQAITKKNLTFKTRKISGCTTFMKRKLFIELNGFEPYFFMYHEDTDFSLRALRNNISIYTTNETLLIHQKINMSINNFTYYYIERNRYICLYKNLVSINSLIPFLLISEIMLIFQAIITRKLRIRLRIYKFLMQNIVNIKHLRSTKANRRNQMIKKKNLDSHLDPIVLGKFPSHVKIFKYFLKIINLIL